MSRHDGRTRSADLQYEVLRSQIASGTIAPGTRLYETTVAEVLGVSRTPAREALNRLLQEGLVVRQTRGYLVRVSTPDELLEIYEVRIALESAAASAAARRRTEFDLARLAKIHVHERSRLDSHHDLDLAFHRHVWAAAHNRALVTMLEQVEAQIQLLDRLPVNHPDHRISTEHEHGAVLTAIADRDPAAAEESMARHLQRTRDIRIDALTPLGSDPIRQSFGQPAT